VEQTKILSVTPFFRPDVGGLANHVLNVNSNLEKLGHEISIIAPKHLGDTSSTDIEFKQIFRMESYYLRGWPYPTLKSVSFPLDFGLKIRSLIRDGNYDLVHIHGHHYPFSWMAIKAARKYGIPSVLTMHGMFALNPNVLGGRSRIENLLNKYFFTGMLSKTDAIIGLTEGITSYAKQFGNKTTKYFTIPNGVNTQVYKENLKNKKEYREKYHIGPDKTVILFSTRFEKGKGIIEFVKAAKNLVKDNRIEVVIVGGGSLEPLVNSLVGDINGIHLLKWQPPEVIYELYISADIFINPSQFEALPLTIIEAMNAGLHIVYTPVGGVPEILKGYLPKTILNKISVEEIERVLTTLTLNFSPTEMGESLTYAQQFDWKKIAIDTSNVYSDCLKKSKNPR
jgi:glycosyltransferase involved in cell wall biosynthesis